MAIRNWLIPLAITLLCAPAQAIQRNTFLRVLQMRGIRVYEQPYCESRTTVALYYTRSNSICISSVLTPTYRTLDTALTHEAVHAAQDCAAGQDNRRLSIITPKNARDSVVLDKLSRSQLAHIGRSYSERDWVIEMEAYALENDPDLVAGLVLILCPR